MKNKILIAIVLILAGIFSSCTEKPVDPEPKDFCSCVNSKDFEQTIPFINEALGDLDDVRLLAAWFKSQPCIADALYFVNTGTNTCEFLILFEEDGITKKIILDVSMTIPLKATDYREYDEENADICSCINNENFFKITPIINEWLSGLPNDFTDEKKILALDAWIEEQNCIISARSYITHSFENLSLGETFFSFAGNGELKSYTFKISMSHLWNVTDFREYNDCDLDMDNPNYKYYSMVPCCEQRTLMVFKEEQGLITMGWHPSVDRLPFYYFTPVTRYNDFSEKLSIAGSIEDMWDELTQDHKYRDKVVMVSGYVTNCIFRTRSYSPDYKDNEYNSLIILTIKEK